MLYQTFGRGGGQQRCIPQTASKAQAAETRIGGRCGRRVGGEGSLRALFEWKRMCANYTLIKVFFRKGAMKFGHFCRGCARNSRGVCGKTATRPARAGRQKNPRRRISGGGLAGEKGRQIAIQHPGIPGRSSGSTIKATRNLSPPPPSPPRTSPRRKTDSAPDGQTPNCSSASA